MKAARKCHEERNDFCVLCGADSPSFPSKSSTPSSSTLLKALQREEFRSKGQSLQNLVDRCLCSRCGSLVTSATASKEGIEEVERDVRRRQRELLQELRKLQELVDAFKLQMTELVSFNAKLTEDAEGMSAEMGEFRNQIFAVVENCNHFHRRIQSKQDGAQGGIQSHKQKDPVRTSAVQSEKMKDLKFDDPSCDEDQVKMEPESSEDDDFNSGLSWDDTNDADFVVPEDGQTPRAPVTDVSYYTKHKREITQMLEGMGPFKKQVLLGVLTKTKQRLGQVFMSDLLSPKCRSLLLQGSHPTPYFLEYDASTDILHVDGNTLEIKEENKTLKCSVCPYSIGVSRDKKSPKNIYLHAVSQLHDHILGEHLRVYQCPQCYKGFQKWSQLREHLQNHRKLDSFPFPCDICGKPFKYRISLSRHKWTHQSEEEKAICSDPSEVQICPLCQKQMADAPSLKRHLETHNVLEKDREPAMCRNCGKCYISQKFAAHSRTCGKAPTTPKPHQCHLCPKSFSTLATLKCHLKAIHYKTPEKSFKCGHCSKTFSTQEYLQVHEKRHTSGRRFQCSRNCGAGFKGKEACRKHEAECKGQGVPKLGPVTCPTCGKVCLGKGALKIHARAVHEKEPKVILCSHCPKTFKIPSELKDHLRTVAGERSLACRKGCGAGFMTTGKRWRHERRCTGSRTSRSKTISYGVPPTSAKNGEAVS